MTRSCIPLSTRRECRALIRPRLDRLEDRTMPAGWAIGLGGGVYDSGRNVAVDTTGSVYVTGTFDSTADFDPGPGTATLTARGQNDGFLAKFDPAGNFLWARRFGGESGGDGLLFGIGSDVAVDAAGSALVTGYFRGVGSITGVDRTVRTEYLVRNGLGSPDSRGGTVAAKFGPAGDVAWVDQLAWSTGTAAYWAIAVDASGAVRVTGSFNGSVDFDPGPGTAVRSSNSSNAFVTKLNADGSFAWVDTSTGTGGGGNAVGIAGDGSTYVTGWFGDTITFDSVTLTPAPGVGFVVKLTPGGAVAWAHTAGGRSLAVGRDAATGADILYAGGDGFVSRLTAAGDLLWTSPLAPQRTAIDLAVDSHGHAYAAGTINFGSAYVSEFDAAATYVRDWLPDAPPAAGSGYQGFAGVAIGPGDAVVATAKFAGTFDTRVGVLTSGGVFLVKQEQPAAPPTVAEVQIGDGSGQRSTVRSVSVLFSGQVSLDAGAFTVTRSDGTAATVTVKTSALGTRTIARLSFSGTGTEFGSLADGDWALQIVAAKVHDAASPSVTMAANRTETFFRLYGDVNGDRAVNGADLAALRTAFGAGAADSVLLDPLDFDGNGVINGVDLAAFRARFGMILP